MILCSWSVVFEKMMGEAFRENATKEVCGGGNGDCLLGIKLDLHPPIQ